jgi:surface protein
MGWVQQNIVRIVLIGFFATVLGIAGCSGGSSSSGSNDLLPDTDGDGIVNDNDGDIDGDGIPNGEDDDIDGDGKPNDSDHDDDGDGTLDDDDKTSEGPSGPPTSEGGSGTACTTTKITWPNDEIQAGKDATITWKLEPAGCALAKGQNQSVKPTATHKNTTTVGVSKKSGSLTTNISVPCAPNQGDTSRAVKYDFSELGTALGDKLGGYKNTIHHAAPTKGCAGDTKPDPDAGPGEPTQCPSDAAGTYPNCSCPPGYTYNESKNDCIDDDLLGFGPGDPGQCPGDANRNSIYPNCSCPPGYTYNESKNDCLPLGNELPDTPEPCTTSNIIWPNDDYLAGQKVKIKWTLLPKGCALSEKQKRDVRPQARGSNCATNVIGNTCWVYGTTVSTDANQTKIEVPCDEESVLYQFNELGNALGDDLGGYKNTISHESCTGDTGGDPGYEPVTDGTFSGAIELWFDKPDAAIAKYGHISDWNVSDVSNMNGAFDGQPTFNEDISGWDVRNVTTMTYMFMNAKAFDQDISGWDVSKAEWFTWMFENTDGMSLANKKAINASWDAKSLYYDCNAVHFPCDDL